MKRSWFSEGQIIAILKEQEAGVPVSELCRKHRPLSSSKRLVGILNAVVQPAADLALVDTLATKAFSR